MEESLPNKDDGDHVIYDDDILTVDEYATRIQEEQEKSNRLQREIHQLRGLVVQRKRQRQQLDEATKETSVGNIESDHDAYKRLRQQVMEEKLKQRQEGILLSRMAMSQPAQQAAFLPDGENNSHTSREGDDTENQAIIVKESVRCRNRLVQKSFDLQEKLDIVKQECHEATLMGQRLAKQNRQAWNQLQTLKQQQEDKITSYLCGNLQAQKVSTETTVLKRIAADLIGGSNLDWYGDERLRDILSRSDD